MRPEQFLRTSRLLGEDAVQALHQKCVTFVGLGAVGGFALEALVRSGVGKVRLVDFDSVEASNINRQIFATYETIGMKKVEAARQRIQAINPDCQVETLDIFVTNENLNQVLVEENNLVIDAIDSLGPKCELLYSAYTLGKPIISSMGAALRRNPALITTGDLMDSSGCPLARQVRTNLRKRGVGKGIQVVYSPEPVIFSYDEEERQEPKGKGRERNVLGSLSTITGIFGLNLAHLGLQELLGSKSLIF
ncbi:MAG: tRNA threonylcarbamoyladenosine dehydratase [Sphaerochaetaceae bacterium]